MAQNQLLNRLILHLRLPALDRHPGPIQRPAIQTDNRIMTNHPASGEQLSPSGIRILVTNDDGIHAPGIKALVRAMQPLGEVYVVAPLNEQSGVSQAITMSEPLKVRDVYKSDEFFG